MKVFRWDDDLAVELPQELIDRLALKEGAELEIVAASKRVVENDPKIQRGATEQSEPRQADR